MLGNAGNRHHFRQTFWWDKDVGLSTYLDAARGSRPVVEEEGDGPDAPITERPPRVVTAENAPSSRSEALRRWEGARQRFAAALRDSEEDLAELETVRQRWATLPRLLQAFDKLRQASTLRPGFWSRLFRLSKWRAWRSALVEARTILEAPLAATAEGKTLPAPLLDRLDRWSRLGDPPSPEGQQIFDALSSVVAAVAVRRQEIGARFVDRTFFDQAHEDLHKATPWLNEVSQRRRDQVFVAAMELHKAFIDAAARPIRHNIGALMNVFAGAPLTTSEKRALLPHLWSSLFLITPVISTTFASMDRMFEGMPPESLGWLLVDEAGQATPQSAVGGLMRSRRAVVVGDPIQIPPVVTLPDTLTDAIQRHFGVDPDRFNAPAASAQTLADAATPYRAEFSTGPGTRTVGVPLLVHRRCADPMFSIANAVAYGGLMVQAKRPGSSPIGDVLGPSRWIDVEGGATDKWSPEEGEATIALLSELRRREVEPNLYVVTPFVVKDGLHRAILESRVLVGWVPDPKEWIKERVGTVHTVQGREAEAVIFVLGAPLAPSAAPAVGPAASPTCSTSRSHAPRSGSMSSEVGLPGRTPECLRRSLDGCLDKPSTQLVRRAEVVGGDLVQQPGAPLRQDFPVEDRPAQVAGAVRHGRGVHPALGDMLKAARLLQATLGQLLLQRLRDAFREQRRVIPSKGSASQKRDPPKGFEGSRQN